MARASSAMPRSFNDLLRSQLRERRHLSLPEALEVLHSHFGDRVGSFYGRAVQLERLALASDEPAAELFRRAAEVRRLCIPEDSELLPELRRADLALGPGALRAILALPSNQGRPVALLVGGLAPEAAAGWVEQGGSRLELRVVLPPQEQELSELLPQLGQDCSAPRLTIVPRGALESSAWRLDLQALLEESLDAVARLLGAPALEPGSVDLEAIATGGLLLPWILGQQTQARLRSIHLQDALYGALPWKIREALSRNPEMHFTIEALPHQLRAAMDLASDRVEVRPLRSIDRIRLLLAQKVNP